MTLSSTAYRSDANGFLWLRTLTDSQPQPYYLTLNIGEKPREPNQTKLSQVLEQDADEKYHLSGTACQGILNRAERRGKELPPELKAALEMQSHSRNEQGNQGGARESLSRVSEQEPCQHSITKPSAKSFMGGQGSKAGSIAYTEELCPSLKSCPSGTNSVPDVLCLNPEDSQSGRVYDEDGVWHSLNANSGGGQSRDAVLHRR